MEKTTKIQTGGETVNVVTYAAFPSALYITIPEQGVGIHITDVGTVLEFLFTPGDKTDRVVDTALTATHCHTKESGKQEDDLEKQARLLKRIGTEPAPLDMSITEGMELLSYVGLELGEPTEAIFFEDAVTAAPPVPVQAEADA